MKTFPLTILLLASGLTAFPQGFVIFQNDSIMLPSPPDRLIRFGPTAQTVLGIPGGLPAYGTNFQVQLYYGSATAGESSLIAITNAPARLRPFTTTVPGTWLGGGTRFLQNVPLGTTVTLQVRVWDIAFGATYEEAIQNPANAGLHGKSDPFLYNVPPDVTYPPSAFTMANFKGFAIDVANSAPTFTKGPDVVVQEDSGPQTLGSWATKISPGPSFEFQQRVTFIVTNSQPSLFSAQPTIATNGTLSFTPATNANGSAVVTVRLTDNGGTANDGHDTSAPQTFLITIQPVNDAPVAFPQSVSTDQNTALPILLSGSDVDNDQLTYRIVTNPTHGTLSGTPPNLSYLPARNFFGPDSFEFSVSDGLAESHAVVTITVIQVNEPPIADASATRTLLLSSNNTNAAAILDGTRSTDADGDVLGYLWFINGASVPAGTGAVAQVSLPVGTNAVTLEVSDGQATSSATIAVQVITGAQALSRLTDLLDTSVPRSWPLVASLNSALASINRGDSSTAINQLQAFQNKVRAQVAPASPGIADSLIQKAQEIIDLY